MQPATPLALFLLALLLLAPATPLAAQASGPDIVVTGSRDRPSSWREAETEHVILLSDGDEADLVRIAHTIERLHVLLAMLYDRMDASPDIVKPRFTLVGGDSVEFDSMQLRNLRAQSGPYPPEFPGLAYYDPREDGPVAALSRIDQKFILQRGPALAGALPDLVRMTSPPSGSGSSGGSGPGGAMMAPVIADSSAATAMQFSGGGRGAPGVNEQSVAVSAESRIYAAYARHFLLTYLPAAYPRWYVDGFGELFSTIVAGTGPEGDYIEYGRQPADYRNVAARYPRNPIERILTGEYLTDRNSPRRWNPYHAWVITHMLSFDEGRRKQLSAYLAAVAHGESQADAAKLFGDPARLQKDLAAWDDRRLPYDRVTFPAGKAEGPLVRRLTEGQAAFVKGRLELGSRMELPPESSDPTAARLRANAIAERDIWLNRLRRDAARYGNNPEAQLLLAEAECRSGNPQACVAAADRALVLRPGNVDALAWKGRAAADLAQDAAGVKAARTLIAGANRSDPLNPVPLLAYYRSFARSDAPPPDMAVAGLAEVVRLVPAAPGPRLELAEALIRRGDTEAAERLLAPVARGAWVSPETAKAVELLNGGNR